MVTETNEIRAAVFWSCLARSHGERMLATALITSVGLKEAHQLLVSDRCGEIQSIHRVLQRVSAFSAGMNDASKQRVATIVRTWLDRISQIDPDAAIRQTHQLGAGILTNRDPRWPQNLNDLQIPPFALWYRGNPEVLAEAAVAIVGARAASTYGQQIAGQWAFELAERGYTVVSGGAYGIDGFAHRGALGAEGNTVAVLAGGIDVLYPAGHNDLLQRIGQRGLLLTERPPGSRPMRHTFLERNRIIAALARCTVVVEAGYRSGALNTVKHAGELGRLVAAVPGSVLSTTSAGCHRLLRNHEATLVTSVAEIIELVGDISVITQWNELEQAVLAILTRPLDQYSLQQQLSVTAEELAVALGNLELQGQVRYRRDKWSRAH